MMDHYYDKLLQITKPPSQLVQNSYLEQAALERAAPLINVCLRFTRNGEEGVMVELERMIADAG